MAKLILTWHSMCDERVCQICKLLEGYVWVFDTASGEHLAKELAHPKFGVVWNIDSGSKAHGHMRSNCRCTITADFDLSDLVKKTETIYSELKVEAE